MYFIILLCLLSGQPPWSGVPAGDIAIEMVDNRNGLDISSDIKRPFYVILKYGLVIEPKGRTLSVENIRDALSKVLVVCMV